MSCRRPPSSACRLRVACLTLSSSRSFGFSFHPSCLPRRLTILHCRVFLSYGLQVVTRTGGPSIVFEAVDVPCPGRIPGPLHFSHIADYVYDFWPPPLLIQLLARMSFYVMFRIRLSIVFVAAACLLCACLVSVQVSAP